MSHTQPLEGDAIDPKTQYRCWTCRGVFDFGWTDEEAKAEREANGWTDVDCDMVCDDCYKEMGYA